MFLLLIGLRNPLVLLQCVGYLLRCTLDKTTYPRFLTEHMVLVSEATGRGLVLLRGPTGLGYGYAAAHDIARIKLYKASRAFALQGSGGRYVWRRLFGPVTPSELGLHELAAVVNKTTGSINLARLGLSASQQSLEGMLMFPRYLRCLLGLVFDAMQGGTRGNESRIVVVAVAVAVAAVFIFVV